MNKVKVMTFIILLVSFALAFYFYDKMPDQMASHWDATGNVNGYMGKVSGLFFMPSLLAILVGLYYALPYIDPLKKNYRKFRRYYNGFILILTAFMFYIYAMTLLWNLGFVFNFTLVIIPGMSILFYYIGLMMEHAKRNWFIGIRTPWTLSSDKVWDKTHKLGGRLYKYVAIISLFGIIFEEYAILFIMFPILAASIICLVYSYVEFKKN